MSECKQCGACCRNLIIEIEHLDILREPKLAAASELMDGHGKLKEYLAIYPQIEKICYYEQGRKYYIAIIRKNEESA